MDRFDPFVKYADVYGDIINWEKDPMNKPQNQNKYFFSDGKTYYEQICKMLRLMSVFKEAFNQIYTNEDEISEAWENFVNNLSASVVEGSEPDVTLTWTDDSVNFEFTMVPGLPGEQGVGITSISFNSDYTMTITLSDGNTYTSMSLKGETGPQGPQGETGSGLQILDVYATLANLQSAHPTGQPGDAYQVGSAGNYILYIWSSSQSAWIPAGSLGTVSPSLSNPLMDGTASAGSQNLYSRGDHVHPSDTSRASKEELDALIKTSQALIDQSFTYRESPAIQDGLARIDKIKGNTLVWNQIYNVNSDRTALGVNIKVENGAVSITGTSTNAGTGPTFAWTDFKGVVGHKYIITKDFALPSGDYIFDQYNLNSSTDITTVVFTLTNNDEYIIPQLRVAQSGVTYNINGHLCVFDLTKMFGAGNEPTSVDEFTSLFSLPYYAYNQGTLLSFNGTGLKTVGFNLFDQDSVLTSVGFTKQSDGSFYIQFPSDLQNRVLFENKLKYSGQFFLTYKYKYASTTSQGCRFEVHYTDGTVGSIYAVGSTDFATMTYITYANKTVDYISTTYGSNISTWWKDVCINFSDTERNGTYEPYTSSTLSLPISTYFPTGMKSAWNVYDELRESKAITRIGAVDLGSLTWEYRTTGSTFAPYFYTAFTGIKPNGDPNSRKANILCSKYPTAYRGQASFIDKTICADGTITEITQIQIKDSSYTDTTAFKNSLQGQYLYYELATPTETAVDLDLTFNAYEDGTEQLLPVNGSVPSTSPIIADMTYLSIDDAMEYVLEKLANVPENTQQILESLGDDVTDLQTDVGALQTSVSGLQTSVGNINTNIGQLSSTVAGHTASISDMQSDITDLNTGLSDLEDTVTDNTSRIGTLETGLSATNGNVQSLSSQVQSIDGRVTNLESDLFKVVVKEFDYDSVASESNFGTTTPITQEEGYRVIGVVGTEAQAGEYTSPASNIVITQCHIYYTSLGALTITIFGRNTGLSARTNVRIYAYLLCIKDIQ